MYVCVCAWVSKTNSRATTTEIVGDKIRTRVGEQGRSQKKGTRSVVRILVFLDILDILSAFENYF